jgi:hypothetical protein
VTTLIVIVTAVIVVVLVVWFFVGKNPAQGEGDPHVHDGSSSDRFYSGVDRPAGPDAEWMSPDPPAEVEGL